MKFIISMVMVVWVTLVSSAGFALEVVTTIPDLGAIAKAVGGEKVNVSVLATPNEDPHFVDPRPSKILSLNKADVLVMIGLELEDAWLVPLVKAARNPKIDISGAGRVVTSEQVKLIDRPVGKVDRSQGDVHPGGNPHFNFDPRAAAKIAMMVHKKFSALDPANSVYYKQQTRKFLTDLRDVMKHNIQRFRTLDKTSRNVVTYHASLGYLMEWLNLNEIIHLEPKPGIAPNPSHVAKVLEVMKSHHVKIIVKEKFYPSSVAKNVAELSHATLVLIDGGADIMHGETYIQNLKQTTDAIYKALSK